MNALRNLGREILGLFVEDWLFALGIASWLCVAFVASRYDVVSPGARGAALFTGLAVVLIAGVARGARPR